MVPKYQRTLKKLMCGHPLRHVDGAEFNRDSNAHMGNSRGTRFLIDDAQKPTYPTQKRVFWAYKNKSSTFLGLAPRLESPKPGAHDGMLT